MNTQIRIDEIKKVGAKLSERISNLKAEHEFDKAKDLELDLVELVVEYANLNFNRHIVIANWRDNAQKHHNESGNFINVVDYYCGWAERFYDLHICLDMASTLEASEAIFEGDYELVVKDDNVRVVAEFMDLEDEDDEGNDITILSLNNLTYVVTGLDGELLKETFESYDLSIEFTSTTREDYLKEFKEYFGSMTLPKGYRNSELALRDVQHDIIEVTKNRLTLGIEP